MDRVRHLNGYRVVYKPDHPKAMKSKNWNGFVYEHIVVAEEMMGRPLREEEEVHHLDFNRSNNSPLNLLVLEKSQHMKLHGWLKRRDNRNTREIFNCIECGNTLTTPEQTKYCSLKCARTHNRKVPNPPSIEVLKSDIDSMSWVAIGKKYGVSDNAVRKWARKYGLIS